MDRHISEERLNVFVDGETKTALTSDRSPRKEREAVTPGLNHQYRQPP